MRHGIAIASNATPGFQLFQVKLSGRYRIVSQHVEKDALDVSVKGSQLMQQMLQHPQITTLSTLWFR